jgi:hypothetical protein
VTFQKIGAIKAPTKCYQPVSHLSTLSEKFGTDDNLKK